jgi:hypothetical protein
VLTCAHAQIIDMPLLFETGAYMLTWPRVLVFTNPDTQASILACSSSLRAMQRET